MGEADLHFGIYVAHNVTEPNWTYVGIACSSCTVFTLAVASYYC